MAQLSHEWVNVRVWRKHSTQTTDWELWAQWRTGSKSLTNNWTAVSVPFPSTNSFFCFLSRSAVSNHGFKWQNPAVVSWFVDHFRHCSFGLESVLPLQSKAYLTERVMFHPASPTVSHNSKPLTFHENTTLLKVYAVLNFTDFGERLSMSNRSCSLHDARFFNETLNSIRDFQRTLRRFSSLPGFSDLVECDTHLPSYYQFMTGQPSLVSCPSSQLKHLTLHLEWWTEIVDN